MREHGGATTQSGILYQNSIAALYLGRLCDVTPRPASERVVKVRVEAPEDVDDIVVTFADQHRSFIQAKENIRKHYDAWGKFWGDFSSQFLRPEFQKGQDRLLLHIGEVHDEHHDLRELCERAAHSESYDEWWSRLTMPQQSLVGRIAPSLDAELLNDARMLFFFSHIDIEIWSLKQIERDLVAHWMPRSDMTAIELFRLLRDRVGGKARYKGSFDPLSLRKSFETEAVNLLTLAEDQAGFTSKADHQVNEFYPHQSDEKAIEADPTYFYAGRKVTQADVEANLDVPRTQYVSTWQDEQGLPQTAWSKRLFDQALDTLSKRRVRIVILYGHRGSGKTTLCRRMIHDLRDSSIPAFDLLTETLTRRHAKDFLTQVRAAPEKSTHVFTQIEDIDDNNAVREFLEAIREVAYNQVPFTIYVSIDTNKWKQIEARMGSAILALGGMMDFRHLRGRLDEQEMACLISKLKEHDCLFSLKGKTDENIWFLFRRKAKKGLLTTLIEVTRDTAYGNELAEILWKEYQGLSNRAKRAYALLTLFHAFGIAIPSAIMEQALGELTDQWYFESESFNIETADVVYRPTADSYSTRNRLSAETLLDRFRDASWDNFKLKLILSILRSLDLSIPEQRAFLKLMLDRKVLKMLNNLEPLVEQLKKGRIGSIQGRHISRVLNAIVRIYQSKDRHQEGKRLCDESLRHWKEIGNQAHFLRAFCCYYLNETEQVRKAASKLISTNGYPFHALHGIALFRMLRDWKEADAALKAFEKSYGGELELYPDYRRLRKEVDVGLSVIWQDADISTLKPALALEKIERLLVDNGAAEEVVIAEYQKLVRRQQDFWFAYLSFFTFLNRPRSDEEDEVRLHRYRILERECRYHLERYESQHKNYSKDVLSVLLSNLARAIFKIDYILKKAYQNPKACEEYFQRAITLKKDNWYAYNWYGTFLKEVSNDRNGAKIYYEHALNGDQENPVFRYNLALLSYEAPIYSREGLERAHKLALSSRGLCSPDSKWAEFYQYPDELIISISSLLNRTDLRNGDPLDKDELIHSDAE
jgi:hypothetical protein